MKIVDVVPPIEMEGADRVLEGAVGECRSGNRCTIWPVLKYVPESNETRTRIAFYSDWVNLPTPEDTGELLEFTKSHMGGKDPSIVLEPDDPDTPSSITGWLRTGKVKERKLH